jgi:hypothetical protein
MPQGDRKVLVPLMTGLNDRDAQALTYLALRIRAETHGAGAWDKHGTAAKIAQLKGRSLAMTAQDIIGHAADAKARTPGVLLGAFKPKPVEAPESTKRGNPKPGQDCPRHPGYWADTCDTAGPCAAPKPYDDAPPPPPSWDPGNATAGAKAAREAIHAAKADGSES